MQPTKNRFLPFVSHNEKETATTRKTISSVRLLKLNIEKKSG